MPPSYWYQDDFLADNKKGTLVESMQEMKANPGLSRERRIGEKLVDLSEKIDTDLNYAREAVASTAIGGFLGMISGLGLSYWAYLSGELSFEEFYQLSGLTMPGGTFFGAFGGIAAGVGYAISREKIPPVLRDQGQRIIDSSTDL